MTPEQTKTYLEWIDRNRHVMEGHVAGKKVIPIQKSNVGLRFNPHPDCPQWSTLCDYKIEESQLRPFEYDELHKYVGSCVLKNDGTLERYLIRHTFTTVCDSPGGYGVALERNGLTSSLELLADYCFVDGSPCGVVG
jgi:hypothetical protein